MTSVIGTRRLNYSIGLASLFGRIRVDFGPLFGIYRSQYEANIQYSRNMPSSGMLYHTKFRHSRSRWAQVGGFKKWGGNAVARPLGGVALPPKHALLPNMYLFDFTIEQNE